MSDCPPKPHVDTTPVSDRGAGVSVTTIDPADTCVRLCAKGDKTCMKGARRDYTQLPTTGTQYDPPGFRYTQGDAQRDPKTGKAPGAKAKREYGCQETRDKKGRKKFTGQNAFGVRDPFCSQSFSQPCGTKRFATKDPDKCPVQLVWKEGQRHLRFCRAHKKAGYIVPVSSPREALSVASEACEHWRKHTSWKGLKLLENAALGEL